MLETIKRIAKEQNKSLADIEKALGLGSKTIYRWDSNSPSVDKVKIVADFLGTSVDYLISGEASTQEYNKNALPRLQAYSDNLLNDPSKALLLHCLQLNDEQAEKALRVLKAME